MPESAPESPIHREEPRAIPEAGRLGRAVDALGGIFALGIVTSAAILILEVALRYGFNRPTIWGHETVIFLTATSFLFGGLFVAARDKHIRVVLIYDALPPGPRRVLDVVLSLVNMVACLIFALAAWKVAEGAIFTPGGDFRLETTGSAWNPPTPGLLKLFLFAVMVLLTAQFARLAWGYARGPRP
jgi:TRAP-type C4-dicarboxylate transport system permease small subunit